MSRSIQHVARPGGLVGFVSWEAHRGVVSCDRQLGAAVGWIVSDGSGEITADDVYGRILDDDRERVREAFKASRLTGSEIDCRYALRDAGGRVRNMRFTGTWTFDSVGAPDVMFGILREDASAEDTEPAVEQIARQALILHGLAKGYGMKIVVHLLELVLLHLAKDSVDLDAQERKRH